MSILFIEMGYSLLKDCGNMYLISSNQFITTEYGRKMRNFLINHKAVTKMLDFGDLRFFENAMTYVSILGFSKEPNEYFSYSKIKKLPFISPVSYDSIRISSLSDEVWSLGSDEIESVLKKIKTAADYKLNDIAKPSYGIVTGKDELLLFDIDDFVDIEKELLLPVIRAQGCTKFGYAKPSKKVLYPYRQNGDSTELIPLDILKEHYPRAYNYINSISDELKLRKDSRNVFGDKAGWYGLVRFGQLNIFNKEKIVTPGEVKHNKFGIDSSHSGFTGARVFSITIDDPIIDIRYILGILNSKVIEFFMHHIASLKSGGYYLIIPSSGKHQSAERKTSFHGKENTNPHKESNNPLMESTSCIIELEA